jgi:predicted membrane channel-forming protein YqfA (hemolysin III family)
MDEFAEMAARERERRASRGVSGSGSTSRLYVPIQVMLLIIWIAVGAQFPWFAFPLLGWGIILAVHGVYAFVMRTPEEIMIERERREVSTSTGRA